MRRVGLIVVAVACVLLQLSLLPALRPLGVVPNLALVLVVLLGLEGTASIALVCAVAGGLALDLASAANFGLWTAVLVVAALATGLIHRAGIELGGLVVPVVMVVAGTVVMTAVILVGLINDIPGWPVGVVAGRLVSELVLNLVLTVLLRPLVRLVVPNARAGQVEIG
jgi:cell shape-determining protein MreD